MDPVASKRRSVTIVTDERPQKRKVTRACDTCKGRKAKCSGTQPCDSCAQKQVICLYESSYSRGRPPTPPLSGASLSSLPSIPSVETTTISPPNQHLEPIPQFLDLSQNQEAPSRASPELEVSGQYAYSTSGLSFLQRAWQRLSSHAEGQSIDGTMGNTHENQLLVSAGDKPFQRIGNVEIPSLTKSLELATMYFDICVATYRMLHRPTVEVWLKKVVANAENSSDILHGVTRPQKAIILAMLAFASYHEAKVNSSVTSPDDSETSLRRADGLFCESVHLIESETGYPQLESAQARLVQVLYMLSSSRINQAWYSFGHTTLIITALGLHRRKNNKNKDQMRDYIKEQCQKRTFWVAYTLDKHLGSVFGRPRHYHDEDIDQDLPDAINDEDMTPNGPYETGIYDCHINALIHHAMLAQIAERISRDVYSIKPIPEHERITSAHRLGAELRQWKSQLPPILGVVNPSSLIPSFRRQAIALKVSYCHAVMLVHRPFLLKNIHRHSQEICELAKKGIEECIIAAQSVLEIVDGMARDSNLFHAFWWTHYVSFCALVVVYVWAIQHNNSDRTDIFDRAERCLNHLAQATATNSPSRRYSIILRELRAEAKRRFSRYPPAQIGLDGSVQEDPVGGLATSTIQSLIGTAIGPGDRLFESPAESNNSHIPDFLDAWQTTDWLDLDSSAFGPFSTLETGTGEWTMDTV